MTTINVKYRYPAENESEGLVYFEICRQDLSAVLLTHYRIAPSEWDDTLSYPRLLSAATERSRRLHEIHRRLTVAKERLGRIVRSLEAQSAIYSPSDVAVRYRRCMEDYNLPAYVAGLARRLMYTGRYRTAETYHDALRSFTTFLASHSSITDIEPALMIDCIDSDLMQAYEAWLHQQGLVANSSSFYMRILRAVYNRAVDDGAIDDRRPFRHVYTGIDRTVKRAISIQSVRSILKLDLAERPALDYARDMFLLSFYLRGMSFVDMAFLRRSDVADGRILYRRRKTGQLLSVGWTSEMQRILDKYPQSDSPFLLPILQADSPESFRIYRIVACRINRNLKKVGKLAGISTPLTLYVARHSWASIARTSGIPLSVISEGMGHDSELTTRIYLSSLDTTSLDEANALVISAIH